MTDIKRNSFLIYLDTKDQIDMLSDEEVGVLFRAIYRYCMDGVVLETDNRTLAFAFSMFKTSLDRNTERYESIVEVRRANGSKGGKKRVENLRNQANQANQANATLLQANQANQADRDSDSVRDSVSDRDRESESENNNSDVLNNILSIAKACDDRKLQRRKDAFISSLDQYRQIYGDAMIDEFADYWTEPNKSQSKMRYELERTWDLSRRLKRWASNNIKQPNNTNNGNTKQPDQTESPRERSIREAEEELKRRWAKRGVHEEVSDDDITKMPF